MIKERRHMWILLSVLTVMLVCITIVTAETYTAGDSNSNGQYQITLIVNPDGSQTLSYGGVVTGEGGGGIESYPSTNSHSGVSSDGIDPVLTQDLDMSGSYGYALLTGVDANGNKAAVETGFTNSDHVSVYQEIGPEVNFLGPVHENEVSTISSSGIEAYQEVCSHSFDTIYSNAYATNTDGSSAMVSASAQGSQNAPALFGFGYGCSKFCLEQSAGAGGDITATTTGDPITLPLLSHTWASQDGKIKNVDSASVSAFASSPNGYASVIAAGVTDGTIEFCNQRNTKGQSYGGDGSDQITASTSSSGNGLYETEAFGNIRTKSQQGSVTSFVSGPNGDSASALSQWTWNNTHCNYPLWVYADPEASTRQNATRSVIVTELDLCRSWWYTGSISAENSIGGAETPVNFGPGTSVHDWDFEAGAGIKKYTSGTVRNWKYIDY
jgi:hypothetical protein